MVSFPAPVEISLASYPASVTLEIELAPDGMIATVDIDLLPAGTFVPKPVDSGNNFDHGKITFTNLAVNKGDTLIATTRVTSISTSSQDVTADHMVNSGSPHRLSSTVASGAAEKFYAEFLFI